MKLQFPVNKIAYWAQQYDYPQDDEIVIKMARHVRGRGFLTVDELGAVARWKSPRSAGRIKTDNEEDYVTTITGFALKTTNERARIEVLTTISGVKWPTASVILHFFHTEKYPILDFRALEAVGINNRPQYTFDFWLKYVEFCRKLADQAGHDMRTLDRALWAYSKKNSQSKM